MLDELEIQPEDVYKVDGPLDVTFLFSFIKIFKGKYMDLFYEPFIPQPPLDIASDEDVFAKGSKTRFIFSSSL